MSSVTQTATPGEHRRPGGDVRLTFEAFQPRVSVAEAGSTWLRQMPHGGTKKLEH